jgi:hypothetical protein
LRFNSAKTCFRSKASRQRGIHHAVGQRQPAFHPSLNTVHLKGGEMNRDWLFETSIVFCMMVTSCQQ